MSANTPFNVEKGFCFSCFWHQAPASLFIRLSLLLLFFFSTPVLFAQQASIKGKLTDPKALPIRFANVALMLQKDTSLVAGTISDSTGSFGFSVPAAGSYYLKITAIGFMETTTGSFEVSDASFAKDFGTISLAQDAKTLKDVTVTSLRPTITQLADRMVVTVEGTAMAAGSNAYTVLSKAPGVFIDAEGNIQLNGRSGVTVMIDGKLTYLSARDLRTMLEGMSAENLKSIEVITNPSAKYDAEGTSGILNINLKKNARLGINGSLYTGYTYNGKQHGYTYGGNLNYKSGRWSSFVNLDAARRVGGREATFTRVFFSPNKTTYFDQVATGNFQVDGPPAIRLGADYNLSDQHSIGATLNYTTNRAASEFLTDTYIGAAPKTPYQYIDADNFNRNTFTSKTANLHYNGKLDTIGTVLSADLDYIRITNSGDADFLNYFTDLAVNSQTADKLYTSTPNGYDIYAAKLDYTKPLQKGQKVEAGLKASRVVSDNDFRFYFNNNGLVPDPQRTNHFYYTENIYAAYVNWSGNLSKKLSFQAGIRGEQTKGTGKSFTTGQVNNRDYLNLFPSVFLQQKVSDNYGINYSYSRRITRPNYGNLNPFRAYRDPYTWIEGNPYLRPQYTHAFSLAQTIKKVYTFTLSYQLNKDVMAEIPILDVANATTVYTTGNVDDSYSIGLTGIAPLKLSKWWDSQNTLLLNYAKYTMFSNNGKLVNDQLFVMAQSNHTMQLPKELRMELNLLFRGPAASGLYRMGAMHRVDIAVKKSFWSKKLELGLNANDLFKGFRFFWTTDINGNVNEFDQYFRLRTIGATLRYNFSKGQKVEPKRRNSSVEEVNRT
jgi:outer membrane receptor protein involved in Fe transport